MHNQTETTSRGFGRFRRKAERVNVAGQREAIEQAMLLSDSLLSLSDMSNRTVVPRCITKDWLTANAGAPNVGESHRAKYLLNSVPHPSGAVERNEP
jgi:hypothetical protein